MLRSILRNVQYYLLFFSILLVLLAFQRLQWYDQGLLPNPYAIIDHPLHGRPRGFTSPDNAGRVYYGGDESKEIGLFKFKLGLFNFALPTFSKGDASWERSMTVPPPPNRLRKRTEKMHLRLKAQSLLHSKSRKEGGEAEKQETMKSSVAYVVTIPLLKYRSKSQRTSNTKNVKEEEVPLDKSFRDMSKALSQSIERAHTNSPYKYQLYALIFNDSSSADDDWGQEELIQSGFKIINMSDGELVDRGKAVQSNRKVREVDNKQPRLIKLLNRHDVIVQISFNSFVLKPMNDLFDVLLKGKNTNEVTGLVKVKRASTADGTYKQSDGKPKQYKTNSTQVDMFALEPLDVSTVIASSLKEQNDELIIFRSSSQQATYAYLKRLRCASLDFYPPKDQLNHLGFRSKLMPPTIVARKTREIIDDSNPKQYYASNKAQCRMITENILRLDRCLYDAGSFDNIGHACSHVNVKNDARVSHFPEGITTIAGAAGERAGGDTAQTYSVKHGISHCVKPWDFLSGEDCSQDDGKHDEDDICTWLCSEWFRFLLFKQ